MESSLQAEFCSACVGHDDPLLHSASGGSINLLVQNYCRDSAAAGSIEPDTLAPPDEDVPRTALFLPSTGQPEQVCSLTVDPCTGCA